MSRNLLASPALRRPAFVLVGLSLALVAFMPALQAKATGHNSGTYNGIPNSCANLGTPLCLYYDGNATGAVWGTYVNVPNLTGKKFGSSGDGAGHYVINNAASIACNSSAGSCFSYYNQNYSGNYDFAGESRYGNLYYTWNDEASVSVS